MTRRAAVAGVLAFFLAAKPVRQLDPDGIESKLRNNRQSLSSTSTATIFSHSRPYPNPINNPTNPDTNPTGQRGHDSRPREESRRRGTRRENRQQGEEQTRHGAALAHAVRGQASGNRESVRAGAPSRTVTGNTVSRYLPWLVYHTFARYATSWVRFRRERRADVRADVAGGLFNKGTTLRLRTFHPHFSRLNSNGLARSSAATPRPSRVVPTRPVLLFASPGWFWTTRPVCEPRTRPPLWPAPQARRRPRTGPRRFLNFQFRKRQPKASRPPSAIVTRKVSVSCWACIGRCMNNSQRNRSEQSPALEIKQRVADLGNARYVH